MRTRRRHPKRTTDGICLRRSRALTNGRYRRKADSTKKSQTPVFSRLVYSGAGADVGARVPAWKATMLSAAIALIESRRGNRASDRVPGIRARVAPSIGGRGL